MRRAKKWGTKETNKVFDPQGSHTGLFVVATQIAASSDQDHIVDVKSKR